MDEDAAPKISKRTRKRRARAEPMDDEAHEQRLEAKRAKQMQTKKLAGARGHLAVVQVTAHTWLSAHAQTGKKLVLGSVPCPNGGWGQLLQLLLDGKKPDACHICAKILSDAKFSMDIFQADISNSLGETTSTTLNGDQKNTDDKSDQASEKHTKLFEEDMESAFPKPNENNEDEDVDEEEIGMKDDYEAGEGTIDYREVVKADPNLELLPENTHKRRYPVRCKLCIRNSTKEGAIFDLINPFKKKLLKQHLDSVTHRKNYAKWSIQYVEAINTQARASRSDHDDHGNAGGGGGDDGDDVPLPTLSEKKGALVPCKGFAIAKCKDTKMFSLQEEFKLWYSYNCMAQVASLRGKKSNLRCNKSEDGSGGHRYHCEMATENYIIVHRCCEQEILSDMPGVDSTFAREHGHDMCVKCQSLGNERSLIRMIGRFYVKWAAARVLAIYDTCIPYIPCNPYIYIMYNNTCI